MSKSQEIIVSTMFAVVAMFAIYLAIATLISTNCVPLDAELVGLQNGRLVFSVDGVKDSTDNLRYCEVK